MDDSFSDLLTRLTDAGVEFILVGGLAAVVQGAPIATFDVDIVHRRTPENVDRLLGVLGDLDARYRGHPAGAPRRPYRDGLLGPGHQLLQTTLGALDALGAIEGGLGFDELLSDVVRLRIAERDVPVLSLARLLELKQGSDRPKDRLAAEQIRAVLEIQALDE